MKRILLIPVILAAMLLSACDTAITPTPTPPEPTLAPAESQQIIELRQENEELRKILNELAAEVAKLKEQSGKDNTFQPPSKYYYPTEPSSMEPPSLMESSKKLDEERAKQRIEERLNELERQEKMRKLWGE